MPFFRVIWRLCELHKFFQIFLSKKTENVHNLECLILQEKSENVIFGKNRCNLGANVTNDAIKVGPPSYKLLL